MLEQKPISLESEAGFRVLFECATISILVVTREGRIELANPCAERLFGYLPDELVGKPLEILIPESLRAQHSYHRESYFDKPKSRPMGLGMELYACKKSGEVFPVEISLGNYKLQGEQLAVAFITDITHQIKTKELLEELVKQRTTELVEALEREREMNELKSRFVSMASHEFRTPLSIVLSSTGLIEQYVLAVQDERVVKHIQKIKSSVSTLTNILNDFLSLDRLEQGKIELDRHTFDYCTFVQEVLEEVKLLKRPHQVLHVDHQGKCEVELDRKMLRYIMINLISNALKYSGDESTVEVLSRNTDAFIEVSVKDNGIGIPEEEQKHLYNKFFRAKNTGNIPGTGLGLTIVKRYVELMGGEIFFKSAQGEGTMFKILFPKTP